MLIALDHIMQRTSFVVNYFYVYFVFVFIFGFFFYEAIAFNPLDEMFEVLLVIIFLGYSLRRDLLRFGKWGVVWIGAFLFYFGYSILIHSNSISAILLDFVLQSKPFIGFFCIYYSNQRFTEKQKLILNKLMLGLFFFTLGLLLVGVMMGSYEWSFSVFFQHPSRYGTAIIILSLFYLYTSKFTKKDKIVFFIMLSFGLLSGKGKFFGFYAFTIVLLYLYNKSFYLKISLKNLFIGLVTIALVGIAAKEKVLFYSQGFLIDKNEVSHSLARPVLYVTSWEIIKDYFPFGSGFGSFATYASSKPYSSIYKEYGINEVYGISEKFPDFIADTHFPSLAQFGVVGIILFVLFWYCIIATSNRYRMDFPGYHGYFFIISIIGFFSIELVADATFTYNRGFIMMMFLGYILNDYKYIEKNSAV
jgi:hypothetical protein